MFQNMVYIRMTRTGRHSSNEERIDAIHLLERGYTEAQAARFWMRRDRIELFFLPPYSPDLNPGE